MKQIDYSHSRGAFNIEGTDFRTKLSLPTFKAVPTKHGISMTIESSIEIRDEALTDYNVMNLRTVYGQSRKRALHFIFSLPKLNTSEKTELFRFYSACLAFDAHPRENKVAFSGSEIWTQWLLDKDFVNKYSDIFDFSVRNNNAVEHHYPATKEEFIYYNEFFSMKCFPKRPSKKCRLELYNREYKIDSSNLDKLENSIFDLLPEVAIDVNDTEVLSTFKTTSSFDRNNLKKSKHFKIKEDYPKFTTNFDAVHTDINVFPSGERCGIVVAPDTLATISWCSLFLRRILNDIEGAVLCSNPHRRRSRFDKIMKLKGEWLFFLPDLEKSGILLPREVIARVSFALQSKYRALASKIKERFSVYENFVLLSEKGEKLPTIRGVGLGMAAEIVTLVEIAIFFMIRPSGTIRIGQFHDDQVLAFKGNEPDLINAYYLDSMDMHESLGMPLSYTKTFISRYPIFLEEYGNPSWSDKTVKGSVLIGNAFALPNIRMAKDYISGLSPLIDDIKHKAILDELVEWFGFEFYQEECQFDYLLGGWLINKDRYMNDSLVQLYEHPELLQRFGIAIQSIKAWKHMNAGRKPSLNVDRFFEALPHLDSKGFKLAFGQDLSDLPSSLLSFFESTREIKARINLRLIHEKKVKKDHKGLCS